MLEKVQSYIKIEDDKASNKMLFLYIVAAYLFSVVVRYYWIYIFQDNPNFYWNGELMINTNDGYAWAEGARDILNGGNTPNDLSAMAQPISIITANLALVMPIKFEILVLWMPTIFGSLLAVPIVLIGHTLKQTKVGFVAALLAGIAWSYYNRTMMGYYDTDLLVIVLPTFVLWGIVLSLTNNRNRYLLFTALMIIIYRWYYGGSYSLLLGMVGAVLLYSILFDRKNLFNYKLILFMLAAAYLNTFEEKLIAILVLFALFHFGKEKVEKAIIPLLGVVILYMLFNGALAPILVKLEQYVFREAVATDMSLKFFNVVQTVREAGAIPFDLFANRISGHIVTFILSSVGFIIMLIKYPKMIVALPMVGLGFLAYKNGLRFTVYAVPVMALGVSFLIFFIGNYIKGYGKHAFIVLATAGILYPNIKHVSEYQVPTVFNKSEVSVLDRLGGVATEEDYVVTWWDYGFPIRYYAKTKTLVDGGKHSGLYNYAPSLILTSFEQARSAKMARLEVEYLESSFKLKTAERAIARMSRDYGYKDPMKFINELAKLDITKTKITRDIYLYLPHRMISIFPTVALFSNMDIRTGEQFQRKYFSANNIFQQQANRIQLGDGSVILTDKGTITLGGNQQVPIKGFYTVSYDQERKLVKRVQQIHKNGLLNVVFMQSYNTILVLDDYMLNSTFIQLFVFENYDKNLFELVDNSPVAKVYKLKI